MLVPAIVAISRVLVAANPFSAKPRMPASMIAFRVSCAPPWLRAMSRSHI